MSPILGIIASSKLTAVGDFESIATVSVSSSTSPIEFTSIPSDYKHLQLRFIAKSDSADLDVWARFNSDTGNNYSRHRIYGDGASVSVDTEASTSAIVTFGRTGSGTNNFGTNVVDILDYTNTNKYKTTKSLYGRDSNGSGFAMFSSGLWMNTNAITSISVFPQSGNFNQYSHFALYGIKGA